MFESRGICHRFFTLVRISIREKELLDLKFNNMEMKSSIQKLDKEQLDVSNEKRNLYDALESKSEALKKIKEYATFESMVPNALYQRYTGANATTKISSAILTNISNQW